MNMSMQMVNTSMMNPTILTTATVNENELYINSNENSLNIKVHAGFIAVGLFGSVPLYLAAFSILFSIIILVCLPFAWIISKFHPNDNLVECCGEFIIRVIGPLGAYIGKNIIH